MFRVNLAFGHRRQDGVSLGVDEVAEAEQLVLSFFDRAIGGGQIYLCHRTGGYLNIDGQGEREPCTFIWAFAQMVDIPLTQSLRSLARTVAQMLCQECVMVAVEGIDGWCDFIGPSESEPSN
jgi:hypothetical protein